MQRVNADVVISKKDKSLSLKICAHLCAMNYGTGYIRSFMHYRMELCLTMEIAVQKCLMQHVRMKEEFVFMEKWQINRFQLRELELNYAGGEKKW